MAQNPSETMDQILELLHQLRRPRRFTQPPPPPLPDALSDEEWQDVLNDDEGDESCVPDPEIKVAQGKERDPLREQLWDLAAEERRRATESWQEAIAAKEAPLSIRARDVFIMKISKAMELMRREERACFREFWRLGNDLRKLQKEVSGQMANVKDCSQPSQVQASDTEDAEDSALKNEGTSGYVEENTSDLQDTVATKCPPAASQPEPEPMLSDDVLTEMIPVPAAVASANLPPTNVRERTTRRAGGQAG
jgi:hypothetical protein